jgi:REP element-mobilizing transposase RayT
MPHTFCNLLVHVVFSTKGRAPLLAASDRPRLYEYMAGLARGEFGQAIEIGGTEDHHHGLLSLRPGVSVGAAMAKWKSLSSAWIKRELPACGTFAWQEGYGAFSVSQSNAPAVAAYIQGQAEHHRRRSFQEEFVAFLTRHGIAYDPKAIWD